MKRMTMFFRSRESERGQSILAFVNLFPIFIVALFVVTDIGRYLYLKNQVRIAADSAALAAAGALDMRQAGQDGVFALNEGWASREGERGDCRDGGQGRRGQLDGVPGGVGDGQRTGGHCDRGRQWILDLRGLSGDQRIQRPGDRRTRERRLA